VLVKYTGNPAVNVIRATVHLKPEKTPQRAINITHAYKIGDRLIERVIRMQQPGNYNINVEGEPENVFVRMAVPSKTD
jgi:hypothetical protein